MEVCLNPDVVYLAVTGAIYGLHPFRLLNIVHKIIGYSKTIPSHERINSSFIFPALIQSNAHSRACSRPSCQTRKVGPRRSFKTPTFAQRV
ncbi:hypothetical protein GALMADRAFT_272437, partial [Galerina marginata CBS 339.88]